MVTIRLFEEQVNELYRSAKMPGLAHLYIGEEAVAVGVCSALRRDDYITSTHRGHGHCLAKGAELPRMFAELLGKEAGYCKGKGGSMHIADHANGNLGANAIVGGSTGIATGAAFSAKRRGTDQVAVCFFGDGALGQGLLYEVMNMAVALVAAGDLRLREQPLQRVHALPRGDGRRHPRAPARLRDPGGRGRRPGRARGLRRCRRELVERARAGRRPGLPALPHLPLPRPPRRRRRPRVLPLEGRGGGTGARSATRSRCSAPGSSTRDCRTRPRCRRCGREAEAEVQAGVRFALETPFPEPAEVTDDVYA